MDMIHASCLVFVSFPYGCRGLRWLSQCSLCSTSISQTLLGRFHQNSFWIWFQFGSMLELLVLVCVVYSSKSLLVVLSYVLSYLGRCNWIRWLKRTECLLWFVEGAIGTWILSVLAAGSDTIPEEDRLRLVSKYLVRSMLVAFYTSSFFAFWFWVLCWACGLWLLCIFLQGIWIQHFIYIQLVVLYHLLLILLVLLFQGWFVVAGLGLCPPSFACTSFLFNIFSLLKKIYFDVD